MRLSDQRSIAAEITEPAELLNQPIDVLQLSARATNCLTLKGIETVGELVELTEFELLMLPNLGKGTLSEIRDVLARFGLGLGSPASDGACRTLSAVPATRSTEPIAEVHVSAETEVAPELLLLTYLKRLPAREYAVIRRRIVESSATLEQLGQQFDVTRERIRQIEQKLRRRLRSFLGSPDGRAVHGLGQRVRAGLGSVVPADSLPTYLSRLCSSIESEDERDSVSAFILWIAGPYHQIDDWRTIQRDAHAETTHALMARRDSRGWVSPESVYETLSSAGIRPEHHARWLCALGFLEMDGGWLPRLGNIPDRAEQILRYRGIPVTAEDLLPLVQCENVRSLRSRLLGDERFKRTSKQGHFALREWPQYDEYTGIAEEIAEEIGRQGGTADTQHLVEVVSNRYGVKPHSVYQYLSAPMFIKIGEGRVRLRTADEMQTVRADPRFCPGLYRVNEHWMLRVQITSETLRGSGRPLHSSVAALVGCQPGGRRVFKSPRDEIVISWPVGSASGPNLGSLKPDAEGLGGKIGDYMFLVLGHKEIGTRLLKAEDLEKAGEEAKLALMIGLPASLSTRTDLWNVMASAIGLREQPQPLAPEDIHAGLMRRNEVTLARLVNMPNFEDPAAILAQLEDMLGL